MKLRSVLGPLGLSLSLVGSAVSGQETPRTPIAPAPGTPAAIPRPLSTPAPAQSGARSATGRSTTPANPLAAPTAGLGAGLATNASPTPPAPTVDSFLQGAPAPSGGSGSLLSSRGLRGGSTPQMIGDLSQLRIRQAATTSPPPGLPRPTPPGTPPSPPSPRLASALEASVRGLKIAENQSPQPQDRVFFSFNYFDDLNAALNTRFEAPVKNLRAYRYIWGAEKTFDQGNGSIGFRLPLNTLTADPVTRGKVAQPGGTSTALGDLSLFTKYILKSDPETGSLLSVGLEVTPPTGPTRFAGANYLQGVTRNVQIQPFLGYLWIRDRFYAHGFSSLAVPSTTDEATIIFNDFGVGYFLLNSDDPNRFLTAVAPTFEVHINTPITHRDVFNPNDPAGTPDVVNLTYGMNFTFYQQAVGTLGIVTPVTGPRPFDFECVFLLNIRFGRSRAGAALPIIGG